MAKYHVKYGCGHEGMVDLIGPGKERERKLEWYKTASCPECYKIKKQEEARKMGLIWTATFYPALIEGKPVLFCRFRGDTISRKDDLKKIGYVWDSDYTIEGMLKGPGMCWSKLIDIEDLEKEAELVMGIGAKVEMPNSTDLKINRKLMDNKLQEQKAIDDEITKLEKPVIPEILEKKSWNLKIYGSPGSYSIYPDGEKVSISDEQKTKIEEYLIKKKLYSRSVESIKKGSNAETEIKWMKAMYDRITDASVEVPEIICGKYWNKKIYGKGSSYSIYLDEEKTAITSEQKEELEAYLKKAEKYDKLIADLK